MLTIDGGRSNAGLLYIDNLVQHMLWAAKSEKSLNQIYNVRDNYDKNWSDFIKQLKTGINGKGIVINLPFWVAELSANILNKFHQKFLPDKEPLLHPLLVRFFSKTCGHSAEKLHKAHHEFNEVGFTEAMDSSCQWIRKEKE